MRLDRMKTVETGRNRLWEFRGEEAEDRERQTYS